jgi:hypothetical protein
MGIYSVSTQSRRVVRDDTFYRDWPSGGALIMSDKFSWAGFTFPRYIVEMPHGTRRERLQAARERKACGPYYHAPKPITGGTHPGRSGYHSRAGIDGLTRVEYADEIEGARIRHTGWFCDADQGEKIRGVVVRLSHGRYLSGWTMGVGMCASINGELFADIIEAARDADASAEQAAEAERDYQDRWRAAQEARDTVDDVACAVLDACVNLRNTLEVRHVSGYWRKQAKRAVQAVRNARDALDAAVIYAEQFKDVD